MLRLGRRGRWFSILMTFILVFINAPVHSVFAAMVGTEAFVGSQPAGDARENVRSFLQRQDIQQILIAQGIDPLEAKARVDSLSDAEVMQISDRIDQLPAGGIIGTLALLAAVILLVLLITDMLGFTNVFTFINGPKR